MPESWIQQFIPYLESQIDIPIPALFVSANAKITYPPNYLETSSAIEQLKLEAARHAQHWRDQADIEQTNYSRAVDHWFSMPWWTIRANLTRVAALSIGQDPASLDVELAKRDGSRSEIFDRYLGVMRSVKLLVDDHSGICLVRDSLYGALTQRHGPEGVIIAGLGFERYKRIYRQTPDQVARRLLG